MLHHSKSHVVYFAFGSMMLIYECTCPVVPNARESNIKVIYSKVEASINVKFDVINP